MYQQNGVDFVKQTVQKVFKLFQDGKIKPLLDSTWALEDVSILDICRYKSFLNTSLKILLSINKWENNNIDEIFVAKIIE